MYGRKEEENLTALLNRDRKAKAVVSVSTLCIKNIVSYLVEVSTELLSDNATDIREDLGLVL